MKLRLGFLFRLLTLAAGLLLLCHPLFGNPRAVGADSARGQRAFKIPFEISEGGGHIFLSVRVNGSEPVWFGFDSGAEQTLMSRRQAAALKLKLVGGMQVVGGGEGAEDFALARNVSFSLSPDVNFVLKEIGVLPLEFSSPLAGQTIAGLLGYDFIRRFVVEIDYPARVMNLYHPRGYRYRGRGESVVIKMMDNNPFIPVRVTLPGLPPVEAMFVIDSGSDGELFFYSPFVKKHKLLSSKQETTEASALGIGGASKIRIGHATNIKIGRTLINNPVIHFSQAVQGDSASTIGAGFIGGKLLRNFKKVIFDQTRQRLILEPYD
jgi:hypothetical protein